MPSLKAWVTVPSKEKLEYKSPPIKMPMNREEYTSLVISARAMAITGGSRAQGVLKKRLGDWMYPVPPQASQGTAWQSSDSTAPSAPQSGHSIILVPVSSVGSPDEAKAVAVRAKASITASTIQPRRVFLLLIVLSPYFLDGLSPLFEGAPRFFATLRALRNGA